MQVPIVFCGGPLHEKTGYVSVIDQVMLFFDERERKVFFYKRVDELVYQFDLEISGALSEKYDEAHARFASAENSVEWDRRGKHDQI